MVGVIPEAVLARTLDGYPEFSNIHLKGFRMDSSFGTSQLVAACVRFSGATRHFALPADRNCIHQIVRTVDKHRMGRNFQNAVMGN